MRVERNQTINFSGKVILLNKTDPNNPLLRPLIKQLKHHCGGDDIVHYIQMGEFISSNPIKNEYYFNISSRHTPTKRFCGIDSFVRSDSFNSKNPLSKEDVDKALAWAKGTKSYFETVKTRGAKYKDERIKEIMETFKAPAIGLN